MSKIKLLVEIDEEDYGDFCDWFESIPSSVDGLPCVKGKFNTALYDAKPYNDSGDCISRSALLNQIDTTDWSDVRLLVEDAPTVPLPNEQIAWEQGYEAGLAQGKQEKPQGECEKCKFNHSEICDTCSRKYSDNYADMKGGAE